MSETDSPSDQGTRAFVPSYVRAAGEIRARFDARAGQTFAANIYEAGGYRLRFPNSRGAASCEAVIVNTGGGVAGGDEIALDFAATPGACATLTSVAAEKVYRSERDAARIDVTLDVASGARLEWLPQETIVFDGAALRRRIDATLAPDATLTALESMVFGRRAMGETMESGALHDRWRIRRAGRLIFAEDLRFDGRIDALLDRPALGKGARAAATLLHVAPDAEAQLERLRDVLPQEGDCEAAASAWDGMLVARFASGSPAALRLTIISALERLRGRNAPRVWS